MSLVVGDFTLTVEWKNLEVVKAYSVTSSLFRKKMCDHVTSFIPPLSMVHTASRTFNTILSELRF